MPHATDHESQHPPYLSCRLANVGPRAGRSFELAYLGLMEADEWELYHGTIRAPDGVATAHAWLAQGCWVYDVVADLALHAPEFNQRFCAVGVARYPKHGAERFFRRHGHYGPWRTNQ